MEIFFSVSLFVLLLFWLNHFVGVAADAQPSDRALSAAAFSLAHAADAACQLNVSLDLPSPCLADVGPVVVALDDGELLLNGVAAPTECRFQRSQMLLPACGAHLCIQSLDGGLAVLQPNPCEAN